MSDEGWVALAQVARPHGVKGALKLKVFNPDSDLLLRARRLRMVMASGEIREVRLRRPRELPGGGLLVHLEGVDDLDAAEALRDARFEVPRDELEEPEEGAYYVVDLIGAAAILAGEKFGEVVEVVDYPTCDVLVVEKTGGGRVEVPLLDAYVGRVDLEGGTVEVLSLDELS